MAAIRPVFFTAEQKPYFARGDFEFTWNPGLSKAQAQRNISALHAASTARFPSYKPLEISSKSLQPLGVKLSAFNLMVYVPSLGKKISVECAFQGSKVFQEGGPYTELYEGTSMAAKKDPRLKSSGALVSFRYEGQDYPIAPYATAFYNWLYINALADNPDLAAEVMEYSAFTDIAYNPNKGVNCQARSAAMFVGLARRGEVEQCRTFEGFLKTVYGV